MPPPHEPDGAPPDTDPATCIATTRALRAERARHEPSVRTRLQRQGPSGREVALTANEDTAPELALKLSLDRQQLDPHRLRRHGERIGPAEPKRQAPLPRCGRPSPPARRRPSRRSPESRGPSASLRIVGIRIGRRAVLPVLRRGRGAGGLNELRRASCLGHAPSSEELGRSLHRMGS
jgi:hypothetical protein